MLSYGKGVGTGPTDPGGYWNNKYVGFTYCRAEMYAGRVAYYPLVGHGEYTGGIDGQTDGRQNVTLRLQLNVASIIIENLLFNYASSTGPFNAADETNTKRALQWSSLGQ